MSPRSFATVLLRCMGIYFFVSALWAMNNAIQILGYSAGPEGMPQPSHMFLWSGVHALAVLAVAIVLVFHTRPMADYMARDLDGFGDQFPDPMPMQAIGLSMVGAWVLASALPNLVSKLVMIVVLGDASRRSDLKPWLDENWSQGVLLAIEVILGLYLLLSSKRLVRFLSRSRERVESE